MDIFFLSCIYLVCFLYLISKKDFTLSIILLVYSGPVSAVLLHLIYPDQFIMGGGNVPYQTFEVTRKMFIISVLGVLGLALSYLKPSRLYFLPKRDMSLSLSSIEIILWASISILLIWFIMPSAKIILDANYHYSMARTTEIPGINVSRTIAHTVLIIVYVCAFNSKRYFKTVSASILIAVIYLEILSGIRSEGMGVIVAMIAYYFHYQYNNFNKPESIILLRKFYKNTRYIYALFAILLGLIWFIGNTRSGGDAFGNFETFEAVASSFMAAIYTIDGGAVGLLYGATYTTDLIMQTLPTSIYPERPMVPAQIILQQPIFASGGAFFAGTAYMNFGYPGSFIMMFLLGRLLQVLTNSLKKSNFKCNISTILYLSFTMSIFRLMYYSELSTYKMIITGQIALLMIYLTSRIITANSIR